MHPISSDVSIRGAESKRHMRNSRSWVKVVLAGLIVQTMTLIYVGSLYTMWLSQACFGCYEPTRPERMIAPALIGALSIIVSAAAVVRLAHGSWKMFVGIVSLGIVGLVLIAVAS